MRREVPMADINLTLQLTGNLAEQTKQAKLLLDTMQQVQRTASQTRAVTAAAASSSGSGSSAMDDGLRRGATGVGGGVGAKDFARQAQGLGGLVHVYATFAANLFAVSAAFTALSKAADMTNMIKGMDQLGAASGQALGSMAKRLADVTDGAVSLKQAMEATAMATSAGLSGDQLMRLTKVAKNASQALGRDMGDALSRLSKGVIKIEPELLDELGIMVRVDTAARAYALTLGKTASQLTDFEKRQSFANAVLEQGEKKFGAINVDANPYNKLLASVTNLALAGGELLNKVLGPLAKLLSESPTALGAALAGISGILIKQAIPAITQWRTGLKEAAQQAAATAKTLAETHESFQINKQLEAGLAAKRPYEEAANAGIAALRTALGKALPETSKLIQRAFSEGFQVTDADIAKYKSALTRAEKTLSGSESLLSKDPNNQLLKEQVVKQQENVALLRQAQTISAQTLLSQKEALKVEMQHLNTLEQEAGYWSLEAALARKSLAAQRSAEKADILSRVGDNTLTMGVKDSFKALATDVQASNLTKFGKAATMASGAIRILGSAIMTVATSLGNVFMVVSLVTAAFSMLDGFLSKNGKQAEDFSGSLDSVNASLESVDRTLELINSKDPLERLSVESLQARATALNELSAGVTKLVKDFFEVEKYASGWDKFIDGFWDIFGKGSQDKARDAVSKSIIKSLEAAKEGPAKEAAKKAFEDILGKGVDVSSFKEIQNALDLNPEQFESAIKRIAKAEKILSDESNNAVSKVSSFKDSIAQTAKQVDTLMIAFAPSDNVSKLGLAMMDQATKMTKALEQPLELIAEISNLSKDSESLKTFDPESIALLQKYSKELGSVATEAANMEASISTLNTQKKELEAGQAKYTEAVLDSMQNGLGVAYEINKAEETRVRNLENTNKALEVQKEKYLGIQDKVKKAISDLKAVADSQFNKGLDYLQAGINKIVKDAEIGFKKALLDPFKGTAFEVEMSAKLDKEAVNAQIELIKKQQALVESNELLRISIDKNTISRSISDIEKKYEKDPGLLKQDTEYAKLRATQAGIEKFEQAVLSKKPLDELRKLGSAAGEAANKYASSVASMQASIAAAGIQLKTIDIKKELGLQSVEYKKQQEFVNDTIAARKNELAILNMYQGPYNEQIESSKQILQNAIDEQAYKLEDLKVREKIAAMDLAISKSSGADKPEAIKARNAEAAKLEENLANTRKKYELDSMARRQADDIKKNAAIQERFEKEKKYELELSAISYDNQLNELENTKALSKMDELSYTLQKVAIQEQKQANKYTIESSILESKYKQLVLDKVRATAELELKMAKLKNSGGSEEDIAALDTIINATNEGFKERTSELDKQKKLLDESNKSAERSLAITKEQALAQATWKPFVDGINDALTAGLEAGFMNGSKAGSKVLIDTLKANLKKAVFNALINFSGVTGENNPLGLLSKAISGGSTLGSRDSAGNLIGGVNAVSGLFGPSAYAGGTAGGAFGSFAMSGIGESLGLSTVSEAGIGLSSSGAAIANAMPYIAAAMAVMSMIKMGGGTPHKGGIAFSDGTTTATPKTAQDIMAQYANPAQAGGMMEKDWTKRSQQPIVDALGNMASGLAGTINSILKDNQKSGSYKVGLAFSADNDSKSRGRMSILDAAGNEVLESVKKFAKNASQGMEQFGLDATKNVLKLLQGIDLNALANDYLDSLNIEGLTQEMADKALSFVNATSSIIKVFGQLGIAAVDVTPELMTALGGIEAAGQKLSSFYASMVPEEERRLNTIKTVQTAFTDLNLQMPSTREGLRELLKAQNLQTAAGREAYAAILNLADAFGVVADANKEAGDLVTSLNREVSDLSLTDLQKQLRDIDEQATGYKETLKNLGQDTTANIAAVDSWSAAMKNSARSTTNATDSLLDSSKNIVGAMQDIANAMEQIASFKASVGSSIRSIGFATASATEKRSTIAGEQTTIRTNLTNATKLEDKLKYAGQLQSSIMEDYGVSMENLKAQQQTRLANDKVNFDNALKSQEAAYNASVDLLSKQEEADRQRIDNLNAQSELEARMHNALVDMKKYADDLVLLFSDPYSSVSVLKAKYERTLVAANTGSLEQRMEAFGELQSSASAYLEAARSTSTDRVDYATKVAEVQSKLSAMGNEASKYNAVAHTYDYEVATLAWQNRRAELEDNWRKTQESSELAWQQHQVTMQTTFNEEQKIAAKEFVTELEALQLLTDEWQLEQEALLSAQASSLLTIAEKSTETVTYLQSILNTVPTSIASQLSGIINSAMATATATATAAANAAAASAASASVVAATATTAATAATTAANAAISVITTVAENTPAAINNAAAATPTTVETAASQGVMPGSYQWYRQQRVQQYASGGLHEGGLRIVGEEGPELEATGPSRIFNARDTRAMLNGSNEALIAEIQELRRQIQKQEIAMANIVANTKSTKDTLIRVTRDGEGMQIASDSRIPITLVG